MLLQPTNMSDSLLFRKPVLNSQLINFNNPDPDDPDPDENGNGSGSGEGGDPVNPPTGGGGTGS